MPLQSSTLDYEESIDSGASSPSGSSTFQENESDMRPRALSDSHAIAKTSLDEFLASSLKLSDSSGGPNTHKVLPSRVSSAFLGYDHVTWYVSNPKQAAAVFRNTYGFEEFAFRGLETDSRDLVSRVVRNGNVTMQFVSAVKTTSSDVFTQQAIDEVLDFVRKHGDAVKDISFSVKNLPDLHRYAVTHGAKEISGPVEYTDEQGSIVISKIQIVGDLTHTLIDRSRYCGAFLPGFTSSSSLDRSYCHIVEDVLPIIELDDIDHCVQNFGWDQLKSSTELYANALGFHQFWSVDEKDVSTEYSALRSIVMASSNEEVLMPINEPAEGKKKSQIEEFIEYHDGPGVQHIAFLTKNLVGTVKSLRRRGEEFVKVADTYYDNLAKRISMSPVKIKEDFSEIKKEGILVDFDDNGYLLQIFTQPLTDRPTIFLEFIQRVNHNGFGAGNFKALFEVIEAEQDKRGNL